MTRTLSLCLLFGLATACEADTHASTYPTYGQDLAASETDANAFVPVDDTPDAATSEEDALESTEDTLSSDGDLAASDVEEPDDLPATLPDAAEVEDALSDIGPSSDPGADDDDGFVDTESADLGPSLDAGDDVTLDADEFPLDVQPLEEIVTVLDAEDVGPEDVGPEDTAPDEVGPDDVGPEDPDAPEVEDDILVEDVVEPEDVAVTDIDEDDSADVVLAPTSVVVIGRLTGPFGSQVFSPLLDGDEEEIVQGPQGGIHAEVALEVTLELVEPKIVVKLVCETYQPDGTLIGAISISKYTLYAVSDGRYLSATIPVYFQATSAALYENSTATLTCTLSFDEVLTADVDLMLVDYL